MTDTLSALKVKTLVHGSSVLSCPQTNTSKVMGMLRTPSWIRPCMGNAFVSAAIARCAQAKKNKNKTTKNNIATDVLAMGHGALPVKNMF